MGDLRIKSDASSMVANTTKTERYMSPRVVGEGPSRVVVYLEQAQAAAFDRLDTAKVKMTVETGALEAREQLAQFFARNVGWSSKASRKA